MRARARAKLMRETAAEMRNLATRLDLVANLTESGDYTVKGIYNKVSVFQKDITNLLDSLREGLPPTPPTGTDDPGADH